MTYIYAIQHNITKRMYIGQSKNVYKRYEQHLCELRSGKHRSRLMQKDYEKYGADYSIYILEEIDNPKERLECNGYVRSKVVCAEIRWIQEYNTIENGYNTQDYVAKRIIKCNAKAFPIKSGLPEGR